MVSFKKIYTYYLSWLFNSRRQTGGQQQVIKHSLSKTATNSLGFENDNSNDWMNEARHKTIKKNGLVVGHSKNINSRNHYHTHLHPNQLHCSQ
mmetsp:Transcript_28198/g.30371  ORF Transcript_28198/g.30371 Transcript_28198/m.30371 type:complete len:93 (-) Transcript_28198:827-1105(-)